MQFARKANVESSSPSRPTTPILAAKVIRRRPQRAQPRSLRAHLESRPLRSCAPHAGAGLAAVQVGDSNVTAPLLRQPQGVVHFLGGAFAGAAPTLAYQFLINRVAEAGYTVIATPYQVTFRHLDCATIVHTAFLDTLNMLRNSQRSWMAPSKLPVHGVGHSNGALLHLLIGSQQRTENASNVIISYNNKQVKEAIPVPLDGLQDLITTIRTSPFSAALPTTETLLEGAVALSAMSRGVLDQQTAAALRPAIDQIGSVLDETGFDTAIQGRLQLAVLQVESGYVDFVPSPPESRSIISGAYEATSTLLIRFADDGIDETHLIAPALDRSVSKGVVVKTLPGTHVTPCGADITWKVGRTFTPLDALALAAKASAQTDLRRLARTIVQWLDVSS